MILYKGVFGMVEQPIAEDFDYRIYHSRLILLSDYQFQGGFRGVSFAPTPEGGVEPLASILAFTLNVPGVTWAEVRAYSLQVRKSPVFEWPEIDQHLINLWNGIGTALAADVDEFRDFLQNFNREVKEA